MIRRRKLKRPKRRKSIRGGMSTAKKIGIGVGTAAGAIALPLIATSILKAIFMKQLFLG